MPFLTMAQPLKYIQIAIAYMHRTFNYLSRFLFFRLFFFVYIFTGYTIQWNHRIIPVFRPDVECTNGIIHVIDHPFLVDSDVHVSGSSQSFNGIQATAILLVASAVIQIAANHLV